MPLILWGLTLLGGGAIGYVIGKPAPPPAPPAPPATGTSGLPVRFY